MSPAVAAVLASTDALSRDEVRELVEILFLEIEEVPADFKLSPAWREEIARRWADLESGRTKAISWEEVQARLEAQRAARG